MKFWIVAALIVIAVILGVLAIVAGDDIDKCLDSGGRWDAATKSCVR